MNFGKVQTDSFLGDVSTILASGVVRYPLLDLERILIGLKPLIVLNFWCYTW